MLHIFIFVTTSLPPHLPISPSINQVKSMAMSNIDGFTPNHLLQQMYGTKVVDEDVDVELGDEELELIAGRPRTVSSYSSDIIVNRRVIVDYDSFRAYMASQPDGWQQINYIRQRFQANRIPVGSDLVYQEIWQQIRDLTPVQIKQARNGFIVDLRTGQLFFNQ